MIPVTHPSERITYYNSKGEQVFVLEPYEGKEITSVMGGFRDGMATFVNEDGSCGAINSKGEVKIKPIYSNLGNFSEGHTYAFKPSDANSSAEPDKDETAPVYIINKKGEEVAKVEGLEFHSIMVNGLFAVTKGERWGFVDKKRHKQLWQNRQRAVDEIRRLNILRVIGP